MNRVIKKTDTLIQSRRMLGAMYEEWSLNG